MIFLDRFISVIERTFCSSQRNGVGSTHLFTLSGLVKTKSNMKHAPFASSSTSLPASVNLLFDDDDQMTQFSEDLRRFLGVLSLAETYDPCFTNLLIDTSLPKSDSDYDTTLHQCVAVLLCGRIRRRLTVLSSLVYHWFSTVRKCLPEAAYDAQKTNHDVVDSTPSSVLSSLLLLMSQQTYIDVSGNILQEVAKCSSSFPGSSDESCCGSLASKLLLLFCVLFILRSMPTLWCC